MRNAFLIPLLFGMGVSWILEHFSIKQRTNPISIHLYHASIATFTIYSILKGILEIYGTTNHLLSIYIYLGTSLMVSSILISILKNTKRKV